MKKVHIHLTVQNLPSSVMFYSKVFGQPPSVLKDDYAKWSLNDPALNFAISNKSESVGLDHWGIEVDAPAHMDALQAMYAAQNLPVIAQEGAACCYAQSDKLWLEDPQGVRCEVFYTHQEAPTAVMQASCVPGKGCC